MNKTQLNTELMDQVDAIQLEHQPNKQKESQVDLQLDAQIYVEAVTQVETQGETEIGIQIKTQVDTCKNDINFMVSIWSFALVSTA